VQTLSAAPRSGTCIKEGYLKLKFNISTVLLRPVKVGWAMEEDESSDGGCAISVQIT
jgi:hypothetical protein